MPTGKAKFPRDKTCGDALSVDVVNQLRILSPALSDAFEQFKSKVSSYGIKIFGPDGNRLDIPFVHNQQKRSGECLLAIGFRQPPSSAFGGISKREAF